MGGAAEVGVPFLKVLIVAQAFPPFNASGAVRVGKLARYLDERGHDVRVITGAPLPYPRTLAPQLAPERVVVTSAIDPLVVAQRLRGGAGTNGTPGSSARASSGRLLKMLAPFAIPEPQIGWYPYAVSAGRQLLREWRPDVIYASALPFTAHVVASRLGRAARAPWVAEFRDHFADNPYSTLPAWRAPIDRAIERRTLRSAAACVTVSAPMAEALRTRHRKPTIVVLNGYDPRDAAGATGPSGGGPLRIVYTGLIYPGRRDPSPLFAAMEALGPQRVDVDVMFYGQDLRGVAESAARFGVSAQVQVCGAVPYADSLAAQREADALLLLLWNDPREAGVYTGKLFEYVGAGRPVLAVGAEHGVAAELIRARRLGVASADPVRIAAALREWVERKRHGGLPCLRASAKAGLSRDEQFARVEALLHGVVRGDADRVERSLPDAALVVESAS